MSKRKAYRQRQVSPFGGLIAIAKRQEVEELKGTLNEEQLADLGIAYRLAFQRMISGDASEESWAVVVGSLNVGIVLAERGYGSEYVKSFRDALDACWRAKLRADRIGRWGFDGEGQKAIKLALDIHDAQIEAAPKYALTEAITEVRKRYQNGNNYQTMEKAA